uniref:C3/C5 convertase n=1 Tax=Nothobranchius furzeri TaxID=105023 RepID=A0A8C6LYR2_NOTFU
LNMRISGDWFVALLCLLGVEVLCDCTVQNMQINGGTYKLTKNLTKGSMLVYSCPEGHYPYPTLTRVCQPNGFWRPAPKRFLEQTCKPIECPDPYALENGNIFPPQERFYVGNQTTYKCFTGFMMRGSSSRICLPNGKWSGLTPICSRDFESVCSDPGIPPGASRIGNWFGNNSRVKYTCNENMFLVGSSERVCQENGWWTAQEPACYFKYTYDTPLDVAQAFGKQIVNTISVTESLDEPQDGRKIIISRNWALNIYIAVDISESMGNESIVNARHAVKTLIKKMARFGVSSNYEIVLFSSQVYEVANIQDFYDGREDLRKIIHDWETFETSGKTFNTNLNLVFQTFEERMSFLKQQAGIEGFKKHRHVLILFSDGAFNVGGLPLPAIARIKDMVYMSDEFREEYLDIFVFGVGDDIFDDDLQRLTVGTGGQHYFRMKNLSGLEEAFDRFIDENEVGELCGLYQESDATQDKASSLRRYPWVAFTLPKGMRCLGSLVSPDFVLTGAACLFSLEPKDVVVEIDDGSHKKKVRKFTIHPNFNPRAKEREGVPQFYDYDVALIRLEESVQISASTRPICIPCTQGTSDALKLVGKSTCKQQEELLLNKHLERLSFLTKHPPLVAEKIAFAKLGECRDSCIQKVLNMSQITAKDPKVAVTDNFLCTGGWNKHRDHITCAGDGGGAVFKTYQHRTIQIGVVSWGTHNLCHYPHSLVESSAESRDFHINLFKMVPFLKSILGDDTQEYLSLQFLEE